MLLIVKDVLGSERRLLGRLGGGEEDLALVPYRVGLFCEAVDLIRR